MEDQTGQAATPSPKKPRRFKLWLIVGSLAFFGIAAAAGNHSSPTPASPSPPPPVITPQPTPKPQPTPSAPAPTPPTPVPQPAPKAVTSKPAPVPQPTPPPSNCNPNYSGCVPNVSYDLNCPDIGHQVRVIGTDVYHLDADHDGTGCDSYPPE